jgi:transcriptional regulator GlxA family with amidase domain
VDALARLLDGPRGRDAYLLRASLAPPWSIRLMDEAPLGLGISRAALARRYTDRVGEPPMTYLTAWRLALAADRLLEPRATIETVARRGLQQCVRPERRLQARTGHQPPRAP